MSRDLCGRVLLAPSPKHISDMISTMLRKLNISLLQNTIYKLDAESRELHDLESRGPDVAS